MYQARAGLETRPRRLEAIVFDFDGTLAELRLDFAEMKRRLAALAQGYFREELRPPPIPALEWLEELAGRLAGLDPAAAAELRGSAEALITAIEIEAARDGALFPFTRPLLEELKRRGVKTAIITRNCEEAVRQVFPDLELYCAAFLARNHVAQVKPHPGHLRAALATVSVAPEAALMVGDHPLDIEAGRRAGTPTAGVWSGHATKGDLERSGADWTASDCEELMRLLERERLI